MSRFRNMKIRSKMLASFMLVTALVMTLVVLAVSQIKSVGRRYATVISHPIALRSVLLEIQGEHRNLHNIGLSMAVYADTGDERFLRLSSDAGAAYDHAIACLDTATTIAETNPELTRTEKDERIANSDMLRDLFSRYYDGVTRPIMAADGAHDRRALLDILASAENNSLAIKDKLDEMVALAEETEKAHIRRAEDEAGATIILLIVISAVTALLAIAVSLYVADYITKPLAPLTAFMRNVATEGNIAFSSGDIRVMEKFGRNRDELGQIIVATAAFVRRILEVGTALEKVADGDLTFEVPLLSARDSMGLSYRRMMENLNGMCGAISASSIHVAAGANQVTAGAQALSSGASEQAASIEELSTAIAEMAELAKTTADMAGQAAELANAVRGSAETSSHRMAEMMAAVAAISDASRSIRKIIKTINEIAFQTNILAVNAAVEAARAGQYGKGFSVVAEEIHKLAEKSAAAAQDTERLIVNSMEKAGLGVSLADGTSASLSEIVSGIKENSLLVTEIARLSEEESLAISQINIGITQVAQVVHQNTTTAEESAAASEEMYNQSAMLQKLVARFRLLDESER